MRIKVQKVGQSDPYGVIVELITASGPARLMLEHREFQKDSVEVGFPLRRDNELVFVALPRQTENGSFRVWVRAEDILPRGSA